MVSQEMIFNIIKPVVTALADSRVLVDVERTIDGRFVIHVFPEPNDVGKIIGKQGRTARAIRTILSAYAQKEKIVLILDINETGKVATA